MSFSTRPLRAKLKTPVSRPWQTSDLGLPSCPYVVAYINEATASWSRETRWAEEFYRGEARDAVAVSTCERQLKGGPFWGDAGGARGREGRSRI